MKNYEKRKKNENGNCLVALCIMYSERIWNTLVWKKSETTPKT
jgi:hypothetical protein